MKKLHAFFLFFVLFLPAFSQFQNSDNPEIPTQESQKTVELYLSATGDILEIDLETYIKGVVYSEMPASFEPEALKAQAVASRTYTIKKLSENIQLCDNPAHCQAWQDFSLSPQKEKISAAVDASKGETIIYDNAPITAVFHASSAYKTESSKAVWGTALPYLISVESPNEEGIMSTFNSTLEISYTEFADKLNDFLKSKNKISASERQIKILSRTESGRVEKIKVGKFQFTGNQFRSIFKLRSSNFEIKLNKKSISINVKGYGHGVGMSQWGAQAMALSGKNYKQILQHYYPNTEIKIE